MLPRVKGTYIIAIVIEEVKDYLALCEKFKQALINCNLTEY